MLKSLPPTRLHPALKAWEAGTTHLRLRACNLGFILALFSGSLPRRSRSNLQAVYHLYQVTTKLRLGKGGRGETVFLSAFPRINMGATPAFEPSGGPSRILGSINFTGIGIGARGAAKHHDG